MCSNCSGDYEDPDVTQWPNDRESSEDECNLAILLGAAEEERQGSSPAAQRNRALLSILKAAATQGEEGGFIGRELRERGII